jgi:hypothetical protein
MSLAIVQEGKPREYLFALWEQSTVGSESSLVDVVRDVVEKRLEARCFGDLGYFSHQEPAYDKACPFVGSFECFSKSVNRRFD